LDTIRELLKRAPVYIKDYGGKIYLRIKVATATSREEARRIAEKLRALGFNPVNDPVAGRYYYVYLTRMEEVKKVVEELIGVDKLRPEALEVYARKYADPELKGVRYRLDEALEDPHRRPALYYLLGALVGDGCAAGCRVALKVKDEAFAEKVASAARGLDLNAWTSGPDKRGCFHVVIYSKHLAILRQRLLNNPQQLLQLDAASFWKFLEGFYEADGSLRLTEGKRSSRRYFEVRIRQVKHRHLLDALREKLRELGVRATVSHGPRASELRIKNKHGIYKLFTNIDPVIKNPRTGALSAKLEAHAKREGRDPEKKAEEWVKEWEKLAKEYSHKTR